jgi:hypothetical protein
LAGGIGVTKVASAIWHQSGLRRRAETITLSNIVLEKWGVDRYTKYRALKYLRDVGLITTRQLGKHAVEVTILCADGSVPKRVEKRNGKNATTRSAHKPSKSWGPTLRATDGYRPRRHN